MKPQYLEFYGINSFSEPAIIDFRRLTEFGLFGVFGDTGSGKSTILDCIGFALYGNVSRARSGSIAEIINYGSERANVIFEFEIFFEGRRRKFRVERELKRKNAVQSVKVYEREEQRLIALSEGVRESNALLERIIGLEQKDFEKCIALPQGEFAQFVKAQRSDRLKLVSRLFDLEEYGERLVRKANARCARLSEERNILLARLEPFSEVTSEGVASFKEELAVLTIREAESRSGLESVRAEERRANELLQKKHAAEEARARLSLLEAQKEEIALLERELNRIEHAQAAVKAAREQSVAREAYLSAEQYLQAAQSAKERASVAEQALSHFDEEKADEEIARLSERRAIAQQLEERDRRIKELTRRLQAARLAYAEEAERFKDFSYDEERQRIENRLKELGEGDFFTFAETHGKAALLHAEYAVFAEELNGIQTKYPETSEDISPLIGKYTFLSEGERADYQTIKRAFEAREKERSAERENLLALEKKNGLYRTHRERLLQLQTEGVRIKEELEALEQASSGESLSRADIERELTELKKQKKTALEARETARRDVSRTEAAFAAAEEKVKAAKNLLQVGETKLREALLEGGFVTADEAAALLARFGGADAKERVAQFREEYAALILRVKETEGDYSQVSAERVRAVSEKKVLLEKELEELLTRLAVRRDELKRGEEALQRKTLLEAELKAVDQKTEIAERLKKLLDGNKFMEFVAEEYLQNVADNGSKRLLRLTGGRYFLRYDCGFLVGDNLGGGKLRSVSTLSGGETFLVSLSLALALSAEICQKSLRPIEFFFLDEGFGTLDGRLVDVVMDCLEKLKGEHFSIGVISHVEELKHRIERKLSVEKATEDHGSRIEIN